MPNVGRPSRDCHLCRARRVKCDLGRPGCQRCAKYGKDCPGYRDQQELVFRTVDPTGSAGTKQKKQQQQRKRKDVATEAEKHSSSSSSSPSSFSGSNFSDYGELVLQPYSTTFEDIVPGSEQDPFAWTIAPSLSQHWTATSVPIVLNVYSSVEFLKDVFRENTTDGPLVWATHLFSRTYVINLQQPTCMSNDSATDSAKELGTYMGKTLSAVATALSTPQGAMRDDIMAAVWMLCNYEIIVGSIGRMETESPWHTHASGLFGMLKSRGKDFLHTKRGRNIFWPTYSLVQLDAILSNHECPPEGEEWLEILKPYSVGFLGYHTAIFLTKVSKFQSRAGEIVLERDTAAASAECTALFSALTEAENDLGIFTSSLGRNSHDSDDFMMVMHLASIVKAYNILLLLTNLATHDPNSPVPLEILYKRRVYCFNRVRQAAWDILAATPDLIAELVKNRYNVFDALFMALKLVWPLTAVRLMPTTLPQQKARAAQDLLVIGRQLGVRQATRSYSPVDGIPKEARIPRKPQGFLWEVEIEDDLCIGYMDSELREPLAAELVGAVEPSKSVVPESLDLFMI